MLKRVQKIISENTNFSRRKAEDLIINKKVKVNNKLITIGDKADDEKDTISINDKPIKKVEKVYLAFNKPAGTVTSLKDPHETTIMDKIPKKYLKYNIYPVGRLDKYTEGLIFLTNDGDFANKIMHPTNKIEKTYEGIAKGIISIEGKDKLSSGIKLEEGLARGKTYLKSQNKDTFFTIKITTGWNRQVRRMFEAIGHRVAKLKRIQVGKFPITRIGNKQIRELNKEDIKLIFKKK